jgi:hypothetical protein
LTGVMERVLQMDKESEAAFGGDGEPA